MLLWEGGHGNGNMGKAADMLVVQVEDLEKLAPQLLLDF